MHNLALSQLLKGKSIKRKESILPTLKSFYKMRYPEIWKVLSMRINTVKKTNETVMVKHPLEK